MKKFCASLTILDRKVTFPATHTAELNTMGQNKRQESQ